MKSKKKSPKESLQKLEEMLILAKEEGNTRAIKALQKVIDRLKSVSKSSG